MMTVSNKMNNALHDSHWDIYRARILPQHAAVMSQAVVAAGWNKPTDATILEHGKMYVTISANAHGVPMPFQTMVFERADTAFKGCPPMFMNTTGDYGIDWDHVILWAEVDSFMPVFEKGKDDDI